MASGGNKRSMTGLFKGNVPPGSIKTHKTAKVLPFTNPFTEYQKT